MRKRDKTKQRIYNLQYSRLLKLDVLSRYSEYNVACAICEERRVECLSIDHIKGGGLKHRRQIGLGGTNFYRWLQKANYPSGFQVLCMNCQLVKYHKEKGKAIEKLIDGEKDA